MRSRRLPASTGKVNPSPWSQATSASMPPRSELLYSELACGCEILKAENNRPPQALSSEISSPSLSSLPSSVETPVARATGSTLLERQNVPQRNRPLSFRPDRSSQRALYRRSVPGEGWQAARVPCEHRAARAPKSGRAHARLVRVGSVSREARPRKECLRRDFAVPSFASQSTRGRPPAPQLIFRHGRTDGG
jgi:hypothetical protein